MVEPKMKSDDSSDAKENLYDHISRTEEPKHYANMVEYARDLQPWLYQYRFWSAMSHISSLMPYYMLQNCSSANQVPAATSQRVSNLTNGAIPNQQNQGSHQQQNQNNQQQQQHHHNLAQNGVEYIIPSLWRRVAAETIDFIVLFYIKVMLTVMVLRHLGYLRDDNLLEVRLDIVPILEFAEMDLEKAFNITSEIIALEIINRIMITLFETLCLRKGFGGIVGGATPDYWLKTSVVYSVGTTTYKSRNQGLWRYCQEYTEIHCCGYINDVIGLHNADVPAYVNATRAFMVIGLIFQIVCLCSLFGAVFCCSSYTAESSGRLYTAILCFGTAFCVLLSIIIYGGAHTSSDWTDQYSLHWSYAFAVISGIIYAITTIVFLFDLCKD